uniref:Putative BI1-like protein n=1 Tax=Davidia involucrata TaxID=16924 RepID=A0A5B7BM02_DAVIN
MATTAAKYGDVENGNNGQLYPSMIENPQLRWAFIRKVYVILTMQLLLTIGVAVTVVFVRPISHFLVHTTPGIVVYILILIFTLILLWPLHVYQKRHPVNLFLLALFTVGMSFGVGLSCAFSKGKIVLEAGILTGVVVVGLTLYTFWAAKRGHDFQFLWPFLFSSLLVLMVFSLIQIFIPLGHIGSMIWGGLGAIVFSGFIIYDTDNIIKRFNYDEYVPAAVSLYLDIINLFLALLTLLGGADD